MDAAPSLHPTDQTLSSYGLGKLDDRAAEAVNEHLRECSDCRKRVAEMSADSFLRKFRDAQKPSGKSTSGQPQASGTLSDKVTNTLTSSSADSLPPGLAAHPDYVIKRELGRGGMGVVYLAHNTMMRRDEVLKVMGEHLMGDPGVLERFLREIQSVAKLRHPNIVTAYHATRFGQSVIFAMEYVEGLDLSKLVKTKGPMPVAHACLFIHQAALGLQHAHEKGLVHRDIKPHNLMLSREGNKATVKILDFGLAKAAREEKVEGGLTATGQTLGTPDYIAPEQIISAQTADIRADIYSLGGTLYYLLTGHPPFQEKSLYDLYQAHISRNADPLNVVRPDVSAELAALVAKMMAKDPAERFQTPGEVVHALKPICTKANADLKMFKAGISPASPSNDGRSVAEAAAAATQLETDADRQIARPRKAAESSGAESRWESIVSFREMEGSQEAAPDGAAWRRSPWGWSSIVVGVLTVGLLTAWLGGVFKVKTPDGMIVLENVPKDAEVLVDGNKITFAWPGSGKPVEIRAVPGQHRVEVNKEGFSTFGQEVTIKTDGVQEVMVRLERLVINPPLQEAGPSPTPEKGKSLPKEIANSLRMRLVLIPAGEFLMGSPGSDPDASDDEKPQHRVRITRPFYLGATEVTQGQYRAVTGQNPSSFKGSDDLPVDGVEWGNAVNFCNALSYEEALPSFYRVDRKKIEVIDWSGSGYRLPTEAEWEYACRGGNPARYSLGASLAELNECAWYRSNANKRTHPVGQKRANAFGLFDMHGNVYEWCWDRYDAKYYARSPVDDPRGAPGPSPPVRRGGCWSHEAQSARSASRWGSAGHRAINLGFRVARLQSGP